MSSWKSLLLRIGDKSSEYNSSSDFKDHIETCFGALRRELLHYSSEILPFLLQCAEQLPHKIPLYGTLIGLLNLEDEDFVKKIVENTQNSFQDALDSGKCDIIRLLMRFLTALMCSKVIQPASVVVVFETLLSSAAITVDEEKGNPSWQARADFYVICILSCLPWGGAELAEQVPEEIERVLVGIQAYMSIRLTLDYPFLRMASLEVTLKRISLKIYGNEYKFYLTMGGKLKVFQGLTYHSKRSWLPESLMSLGPLAVRSSQSCLQQLLP